jgi:hypothetical protein
MTFKKEYEIQTKRILDHFEQSQVSLSNTDKSLIEKAVREAYGAGYEDGLADGKEISEHPISG